MIKLLNMFIITLLYVFPTLLITQLLTTIITFRSTYNVTDTIMMRDRIIGIFDDTIEAVGIMHGLEVCHKKYVNGLSVDWKKALLLLGIAMADQLI